ncbi:chymotrypsin inhibitor-like [Lucilia sericata]|uniref:chymotrypsin inhibitor-like n=1 Tax=Lucilia sericata TaxID=13632 RepID=UPI0018A8016A|nr:chymotrypsin inhibitor-like [Lucilia sericata]
MAKLFQQIFLVLAIVFAFAATIQAQGKQCPPNQEWKTCGTACPAKCGEPAPKFCTYQCIVGCQCKDGYMLKSNGDCVAQRDC